MSSVNNIRDIRSTIDLGPTTSLQFMFATLQLSMAEISKNGALDYMKQIQNSQDEQKQIAAMMQSSRQAQANAKESGSTDLPPETIAYMQANGLAIPKGENADKIKQAEEVLARCNKLKQDAVNGTGDCPWDKKASMMTEADQKFFKDNGIAYDTYGNDRAHNPTEWSYNIKQLEGFKANLKPYSPSDLDTVIQSLQARLDQVGSSTQQHMVYVQDFMGQYNSYLTGSNSVIQQANQTLAELAKTR